MKALPKLAIGLAAALTISASAIAVYASVTSTVTWTDLTTAAATGYCLAHHPYSSNDTNPYTADGYEKVAVPGVVGAVRRNFVQARTSLTTDEGQPNSCATACAEFGKFYGPTYHGYALHQKLANGSLITSGLGDLAATSFTDHDFYLQKEVVAGMWSRGNSFVEGGVAQADLCCCEVK